jgi:hypothetical protein
VRLEFSTVVKVSEGMIDSDVGEMVFRLEITLHLQYSGIRRQLVQL